jgi:hypothetical protein
VSDPGARALLWAVLAQVALTAAVWVALYVARLGEMRRRRIDPQRVATSRLAVGALENVAAADNFRNLFEVPVLFYAVVPLLLIADAVSGAAVALGWAFVVLRVVHSVIHVTYNRVVHRFLAYAASTLCAFALWALLGVALWRQA